MSQYRVIKLNSGEEVVGKVNGVVLESPAVIIIRQNEQGGMGVMLVPFMPYADEFNVTLPNLESYPWCVPQEDILNEYKRLFDPNAIIVPSSKIVT